MAKTQGKIRIGSRASRLAVAQAAEVKKRLIQENSELDEDLVEIVRITTSGDKLVEKNLAEAGGKGLFTKEIEEALFDGSIDIAVHSMKDMPDRLPDGLIIDCILEREDPRDAFISSKAGNLDELEEGSVVGTSSLRRQSQLLALRPDLKIIPLRGNVQTRLEKLERGDADATLLAVAGLNRINLQNKITAIMETDKMLPAVAQGAIGVESLETNATVRELLQKINHVESKIRVDGERAFLIALGGSCTTPIAALAEIDGDRLNLRTLIAAPDGSVVFRAERSGNLSEAKAMGEDAGRELHEKGEKILQWR